MWLLGLWLATAHAEMPLPSYRDALVRECWYEANALLEAGLPEEAAAKATAFQENVEPDGTLEYLVGLSWRVRGDAVQARTHYEAALALDGDLQEAWYDLGELYVMEARYPEAEKAFAEVARLVPDGPQAWIGPWRLAEVAAHQKDPEKFERHLKEALERGFSFKHIEGLPAWKAFYADPAMHDSVEKMVTVYGTQRTLDSLRP